MRGRRTLLLLAALAVLLGAGTVAVALGSDRAPAAADWYPVESASPAPSATTSPSPVPSVSTSPSAGTEVIPASFPHSGPATWRYGTTTGPVLGTGGTVHTFRLAVESNVSTIDLDAVAAKIDATLGDPRSWIASGTLRFQRVDGSAKAEFTLYLATAQTTRNMCLGGGVTGTGTYTSCRYTGHVVLNLDRWYLSVHHYYEVGVPLDTYRTYMINHEVGHQAGHSHERCPGNGKPAPVMEQQTLGLHGCTPNPWPYVDGKLYQGPPGHY